jgi:carbonic anhydrase/acetyltransferase-like protein (isoleucine patch superfamily)
MSPPTLWQSTRQLVGRAVRESGQALDRLGVKVASLAVQKDEFYDDPVIYEDHLSRHRQLLPLLSCGRPVVHPDVAYVAPCSTLIGTVRVGKGSSVWYGAVLRGDSCENAGSFKKSDEEILALGQEEFELEDSRYEDRPDRHGGGIYVGEDTNLQDGCIVTARNNHCRIGNGVTVGHLAQIHSATVEDFCLIGMGSVIGEGAYIESEAFIAAGAVVKAGEVIRSGELWVGNPARKMRDLTAEQRQKLHYQSSEYVAVATEQQAVMQLGGNLSESMLEQFEALEVGAEESQSAEEERYVDQDSPDSEEKPRTQQ